MTDTVGMPSAEVLEALSDAILAVMEIKVRPLTYRSFHFDMDAQLIRSTGGSNGLSVMGDDIP